MPTIEQINTTLQSAYCCLAQLNGDRIRAAQNGERECDEDLCKLINLYLNIDVLIVQYPYEGEYELEAYDKAHNI